MKTVLTGLCVAALVYTVISKCNVCKPGPTASECETFSPPGSERDACILGVDEVLCRKYGKYLISCFGGTGLSFWYFTCTKSCAVSDGHKLTPGLLLLLAALGFHRFNQH